MTYRQLIKLVMQARRCGWYATRQHMIKTGVSMADRAYVLCCLLRIQGQQEAKTKQEEKTSKNRLTMLAPSLRMESQ